MLFSVRVVLQNCWSGRDEPSQQSRETTLTIIPFYERVFFLKQVSLYMMVTLTPRWRQQVWMLMTMSCYLYEIAAHHDRCDDFHFTWVKLKVMSAVIVWRSHQILGNFFSAASSQPQLWWHCSDHWPHSSFRPGTGWWIVPHICCLVVQ